MEVSELTHEERLALVGLMKAVIQADRIYSDEESEELRKVAKLFGKEQFQQTVAEARELFRTLSDIKDYAVRVERPEARELMFELLDDLAQQDDLVQEERELLGWLSRQWEIDSPYAESE